MARMALALLGVLALSSLLVSCTAFNLEKPEYTVLHVANDYEVRIYSKTVWAVAKVDDVSFEVATTRGFHRLFQYIEGGNLNWTKIDMTAPVWTGILPSAGPFCSSAFAVRLYIPEKYQDTPPTPLEELDLTIERYGKQTIAVRTFSGYAQDWNVAQEAERLAIALSKSDFSKNATFPANGQESYGIAQFSSPFQFWDRANEVWVAISIPGFESS